MSAHLLIRDKSQPFGNIEPDWYAGELLELASDLASRLLPAFENSQTGLPHPRVNIWHFYIFFPFNSQNCYFIYYCIMTRLHNYS